MTSVPLKAMGRFIYEAVAVDPVSGIVYETEDRQLSGFYRFIPRERGVLANGGALEMLAIDGRPNYDTADGQTMGTTLPVVWVGIDELDPRGVWGDTAAVFSQGFTKGGARFSRLQGCWWGDGGVFFTQRMAAMRRWARSGSIGLKVLTAEHSRWFSNRLRQTF